MSKVTRTGEGTQEDPAKVTIEDEFPALSEEQIAYLLNGLRSTRIAKRQASGKTLSYLESWDVRAHLSRIFGFGNWDLEMLDYEMVDVRHYQSSGDSPKPMIEPMWQARMQLTVRDQQHRVLAVYAEAAVGSASGPEYMAGELHDNALKTAASDALKRCAINLGTQFGLSLYNNGMTNDVVKVSALKSYGEKPTQNQEKDLAHSVGVEPTGEGTNEGGVDPSTTEAQHNDGTAADVAKEQGS